MIRDLNTYRALNEAKQDLANLADDIEIYSKDEPIQKLDTKEWGISSIVDVIVDPETIKKYETINNTNNIVPGTISKPVTVGSILWLTCMLEPRTKSTAYNAGEMGVVQVRVIKAWRGLNKLQQLQRQGKL